MNEIFLSVIIPFYNPSIEEVKRCVNSVRGFTFPFEIIVVDDGSQDEISRICADYFAEISEVKYIKQKNSGVSVARNTGIKESGGEYILFLDADDEIPKTFIEYLNLNYRYVTADWVISGIEMRNINGKLIKYRSIINGEYIKNKSEILEVEYENVLEIRAKSTELNESCGKLIKGALIKENAIFFPAGVLAGEDAQFNTRLLRVLEKVQYIPLCGYTYYYVPKLRKHFLNDPKKRYHFSFDGEKELIRLIKERSNMEKRDQLLKKQKCRVVIDLVRDCFASIQMGQHVKNFKDVLQREIDEFKLFDSFRIKDCEGVKGKCYYLMLKYRMWDMMRIIILIRKAQNIVKQK